MFRHKKDGQEFGDPVREHRDGAIEVRASVLVHGPQTKDGKTILGADNKPAIFAKHVQVHVFDIEGVEKAARFSLTDLVEYAQGHCNDAARIEITPENAKQVVGEINASLTFAELK